MNRIFPVLIAVALCPVMVVAVDRADPFQGDWAGEINSDSGTDKIVAQVIAEGSNMYRAQILDQFDKRIPHKAVLEGSAEKDSLNLSGDAWRGTIKGQTFTGTWHEKKFTMKKVHRPSPTLGCKPPEKAIILFDGKDTGAWQHRNGRACRWNVTDEGTLQVEPGTGSIVSRKTFGDIRLHLEFRIPFLPGARGQKRGNSGVYLQGRYEIQILDSYGLQGRDNECGGIYKTARPKVNMCAPPGCWQTYDIDFTAARFDDEGKKISNARVTVVHNGVTIHENQEIRKATGSPVDRAGNDFILLQDHKDKVEYRNIWVLEK